MQSLDYKLKTSNTSYVTARHDVQYFPSSLSSFSPTTSRRHVLHRSPAFRVRNTDGTNPLAPATPNPACFVQRVQVFAKRPALRRHQLLRPHRALLSGRSLVFSYPTVHTQQSSVPNGVAEHNVTVARAFTKLMGAFVTFWDNDAGSKIHLLANPGQDVAPIGAARQEDSLLESQMQLGSLQYPHNPMKGASGHFHFLSVLAGTYDDIDIGRVGYLRHSFIAGFPTERVPKMPLSGSPTAR